MIANTLADEIDIVYLCGADSPPAPEGFKTISTPSNALFLQALTSIKPDLLLRDSGSTIHEEIEKIAELVPSIIHFDDFGDGGKCADLVFQTLYVESNDSAQIITYLDARVSLLTNKWLHLNTSDFAKRSWSSSPFSDFIRRRG